MNMRMDECNKFFDLIVKAFDNKVDLTISDEEFLNYDNYVDFLIEMDIITKHSSHDFTGEGFAKSINDRLKRNGLSSQIIPLKSNDPVIETKVKGQGVYFLVEDKIAILTWSTNAVTFWDPHICKDDHV